MVTEQTIISTVTELISSKREGVNWDFKRLPHSNNSDLLHDIICLANSHYIGPKYIIIGVSDPSDGCELIGLQVNTPNRKKQHDYIDFLRDKKFAGDQRPSIEVHTIHISGKELDVLKINDSQEKPFFLTDNYKDVRAYYIYIRIGDTNTPKDKSADIYHLEKLWRQRFGIDLRPIERFEHLLEEKDCWNIDVGNQEYSHHSFFPEYQIRFGKTHDGRETYSYYFPNEKSFFGKAYLMYFTTVLKEIGYCTVDEFRIPLVAPIIEHVRLSNQEIYFYYFERDTIEWKLNELLGLYWIQGNSKYCPIVVFESASERMAFKDHLIIIGERLVNAPPDPIETRIAERMRAEGNNFAAQPEVIGKIVREYLYWRKQEYTQTEDSILVE